MIEEEPKSYEDFMRIRHEERTKYGYVMFVPRGIGGGWQPCFICGGSDDLKNELAGFVNSKEDGQRLLAMFKEAGADPRGCYLDYREHEPNWIQVKIGACPDHYINLLLLSYAVKGDDDYINTRHIEMIIDPYRYAYMPPKDKGKNDPNFAPLSPKKIQV